MPSIGLEPRPEVFGAHVWFKGDSGMAFGYTASNPHRWAATATHRHTRVHPIACADTCFSTGARSTEGYMTPEHTHAQLRTVTNRRTSSPCLRVATNAVTHGHTWSPAVGHKCTGPLSHAVATGHSSCRKSRQFQPFRSQSNRQPREALPYKLHASCISGCAAPIQEKLALRPFVCCVRYAPTP